MDIFNSIICGEESEGRGEGQSRVFEGWVDKFLYGCMGWVSLFVGEVRDLRILERFAGEWKERSQAEHGLTVDEGMSIRLASWGEHILYLCYFIAILKHSSLRLQI